MISATATFTPASGLQDRLMAALQSGVVAGAKLIQAEAQRIVPVRTGDLRESIEVGDVQSNGPLAVVEVSAGTDHAFFVEYGTGQRGAASAGAGSGPYSESWPGMAARPYMRPALVTVESDVIEAVAQEVRNAV